MSKRKGTPKGRPVGTSKHTKGQVIEAMLKHGGDLTAVAKDLGLVRESLYAWKRREPDVAAAIEQARKGAKVQVTPCPACQGSGVVEHTREATLKALLRAR